MTDYAPLTRREARLVRKFLAASIRMTPENHPPGEHSWSTFENTSLGRKGIPDFAVCACGEIRRLA